MIASKKFILIAIIVTAALTGCREKTDYSWEKDLKHRIALDFCRTPDEVKAYIRKYIPNVTDAQITDWTASGKLEAMRIDGELKYFRNAAPNLFRIDSECRAIKESITGRAKSSHMDIGEENVKKVAAEVMGNDSSDIHSHLGQPKRIRVKYTLTIDADAVPDGEEVRCWLPYPRTDIPRQQDVKFIEAGWISRPSGTSSPQYFRTTLSNSEELTFSGNASAHSTLYMKTKASSGWPLVFYEEFEYTSYGEWIPLGLTKEDKDIVRSKEAERYLGERENHIKFTPRVLELRDSLSKGLNSQLSKAQAFYNWVDNTFPWASAREYSTIPNIPEYVLKNRHGDCGQVSLLFITLCRSAGIPARFQSGLMMHPGEDGLHDWAEIWLDGYGWIPVDQSFGGEYYMGAIDSYRLVVNNDFGRTLIPEKKYPRSETVDFQRGEVEWRGGNIYFDQWNYVMNVTYLK